jgi:hypothetical protein
LRKEQFGSSKSMTRILKLKKTFIRSIAIKVLATTYVLYNLAAQSIEHTMKMIFYGELEAG